MSDSVAFECPEPLRQALLELLKWTLLLIRNDSTNANLCNAYADHMHNVPDLLARFHPNLLAYYWEVERTCFIRYLTTMDLKPPPAFEGYWQVVEGEYHRLCSSPDS